MLYVGKIFVSRLWENKVQCYLATRPEVEEYRASNLPEVKSLRVQSFVACALPSREEPDISLSM